jgi:hypothetical protein
MMKWKYSGVPGRDLHDALEWCVANFGPHSYLEIGVDGGGSLRTVLDIERRLCSTNNGPRGEENFIDRIVLCDLWTGHAGHPFKNFAHIGPILTEYGKKADFMPGDSAVTVPTIEGQFDLVLVDGGHDEETAYKDLVNAWPKVAPGGILILDDYGHHMYPGVYAAYKRWNATHPGHLVIEADQAPFHNCIVFRKPAQ